MEDVTDHGRTLVGCRRRPDGLRVEIWDTWDGITDENLEAVFKEFHRLDRTDSSKLGLGLGRYIVRRFAELLGHAIRARSMPGRGSMFALVIGAHRFDRTRRVESPRARALSLVVSALLVEDDPAQLFS